MVRSKYPYRIRVEIVETEGARIVWDWECETPGTRDDVSELLDGLASDVREEVIDVFEAEPGESQ